MSKYGKTAGLCLTFLSPALAAGTASPTFSLACSLILFISACGSAISVRLVKSSDNPALCAFAAFLPAAALSFGGELIMSAAFPTAFDAAPTLVLTGTSLFFAAGFAASDADRPLTHSLCFISASAFAVIFLGSLRAFLRFVPLYDHISMGLVLAGITAAVVHLIFPSDEKINLYFSSAKAFNFSLCLACVFLLTDAVHLLSGALWSTNTAVLITCLSAFVFSLAALRIFAPDFPLALLSTSSAVLALAQPERADWGSTALSALVTAIIIIIIITAISPALRRIKHSDSPRCIKGLPSMLLILGLAALAFGAF